MTTAQLQAFKAAIAANANLITAALDPQGTFVGVAIDAISPAQRSEEGAQAIANWYNLVASPAFLMFNSAIPLSAIKDQILWANYTPAAPIDSTVTWTNASLQCQGKQFNLQTFFLEPSGLFDAVRVNLRKGIKDATSNVAGGSPAGTLVDGGWTTSLGAAPGVLTRNATNFEALFAAASSGPLAAGTGALGSGGAQGVANVSVPATDSLGGYLQGAISFQDVFNAWSS